MHYTIDRPALDDFVARQLDLVEQTPVPADVVQLVAGRVGERRPDRRRPARGLARRRPRDAGRPRAGRAARALHPRRRPDDLSRGRTNDADHDPPTASRTRPRRSGQAPTPTGWGDALHLVATDAPQTSARRARRRRARLDGRAAPRGGRHRPRRRVAAPGAGAARARERPQRHRRRARHRRRRLPTAAERRGVRARGRDRRLRRGALARRRVDPRRRPHPRAHAARPRDPDRRRRRRGHPAAAAAAQRPRRRPRADRLGRTVPARVPERDGAAGRGRRPRRGRPATPPA